MHVWLVFRFWYCGFCKKPTYWRLSPFNCLGYGKAEFFPVWRNGYVAFLVILCSRWMWVVSFTGRPLYPQGKIPRCPLNGRPGGCQSRSGHFGEENKYLPSAGIEPRLIGCPASCLVTVPISRKHNPGWTAVVKDAADRYRSRVHGFHLHQVDERTPISACAKFPVCLLTVFCDLG